MSASVSTGPELSYPISEFRLDNGMRVIVSTDRTAPIVAVNLWYDVGSRDERPGEWGLAHLFEHLMFEGSAHTSKGEHLQAMQSMGGQVNATTWFDRTNYFETIPIEALDIALWFEADRLASVGDHLTPDTVANQRDVVLAERRQRYDNAPYGDVLERITSMVFPQQHPYGHTTIGHPPDLDAVTVATAREFFTTHYGPNTAVLSLVGDLSPEAGLAAAQRYFGHLPPVERPERTVAPPLPPLTGGAPVDTAGRVPANAAYAVWRLPASTTAAIEPLRFAFHALGGGQSSRLHRRLVREDKAAASTGASLMDLAGGNSIGFAYALGLPDVSAGTLSAALIEQIGTLSDGITPAEHGRALATLERDWLAELASVDDRADRLGEFATLHGDPHRVNSRLSSWQALTSPEVSAAIDKWLTPDQTAILHYRREDA